MILHESLRRARMLAAVLAAGWRTACAHRGPTTSPAPASNPAQPGAAMPASALPPVPRVRGPLALRVVYPASRRRASDPRLELPVRDRRHRRRAGDDQRAAGAGVAQRRVARLRGAAARQRHAAPHRRPDRFRLDSRSSIPFAGSCRTPVGWPSAPCGSTRSRSRPRAGSGWDAGEYLTLSARAAEGAEVRLRLPDGTIVPLTPQPQAPSKCPPGSAPSTVTRRDSALRVAHDRFVGLLRGRPVGPDPGPVLPLPAARRARRTPPGPTAEAILGTDTARVRWPLQVALLDSAAARGRAGRRHHADRAPATASPSAGRFPAAPTPGSFRPGRGPR